MTAEPIPPPPLFQEETTAAPKWAQEIKPSEPKKRWENRVREYRDAITKTHLDIDEIRELARSGIPDSLRGVYWKVLLGYYTTARCDWDVNAAKKHTDYLHFVEALCAPQSGAPSRVDVDVPRTLPTLHFFQCEISPNSTTTNSMNSIPHPGLNSSVTPAASGVFDPEQKDPLLVSMSPGLMQSVQFDNSPTAEKSPFSPNQLALRRILMVFEHLNPGLGYVQGMNEVVGHLLYTFSTSSEADISSAQPEPDTFFAFQALQKVQADNFCRALDFANDVGISSSLRAFSALLEMCDPELHAHTVKIDLKPVFFGFRWVTLMLSQEFEVPDVLRLWDFLLSYAEDIECPLLFCTVAMMINVRESLLEMAFGPALQLLQQYPPTDVSDIILCAQKLIGAHGLHKVYELKKEPKKKLSLTNSFRGFMDAFKEKMK